MRNSPYFTVYLPRSDDGMTGAQGKGLAREFAKRFQALCKAYKIEAQRGHVAPGSVNMIARSETSRWLFFVATKRHWRDQSRIEDIATAARGIRREALRIGARSVAIPALGCGEGGLSWEEVRSAIEPEASRMSLAGVDVTIYEPWERSTGRPT